MVFSKVLGFPSHILKIYRILTRLLGFSYFANPSYSDQFAWVLILCKSMVFSRLLGFSYFANPSYSHQIDCLGWHTLKIYAILQIAWVPIPYFENPSYSHQIDCLGSHTLKIYGILIRLLGFPSHTLKIHHIPTSLLGFSYFANLWYSPDCLDSHTLQIHRILTR